MPRTTKEIFNNRADERYRDIERSWLKSAPPPSRAAQPRVLIRSRPVDLGYRCIHCGRLHRLDPGKLGVVVTAECGRGPVAVELDVPGAE